MTLNIPIPENLDQETIRHLENEARESIAVLLYRQGKMSHGQFAKYLGIGRGLVDEVIGRHARFDEFSAEEIADQARSLQALRKSNADSK